ncbi:MAG: hypothetical protein K5764_09575 [Prevotella sp.]|nr:hypothetical protein [Prevotella sp.]
MKKVLFAFAALMVLAACGNKQTAVPELEVVSDSKEIAYEVANNYFFKNDVGILPENPKITSEEEFNKLFGMATTMGENGTPTEIDFTRQFVLAIVLPVTEFSTEIIPVSVVEKGDSLLYTFEIKTGEKQTFSIQPVSIIILDKKYANKKIVLVSDRETTYFPAIDRYLVDSIGKYYAAAAHYVPQHCIVAVDERDAEDIKVWGDFWIFNYNQAGDTLKFVSGGAHPGLMHIRQTEKGFEVTAFEPVEDGSNYVPSAKRIFGDKYDAFQAINSDTARREQLRAEVLADYVERHHLTATMYQDHGWPAKKIRK